MRDGLGVMLCVEVGMTTAQQPARIPDEDPDRRDHSGIARNRCQAEQVIGKLRGAKVAFVRSKRLTKVERAPRARSRPTITGAETGEGCEAFRGYGREFDRDGGTGIHNHIRSDSSHQLDRR